MPDKSFRGNAAQFFVAGELCRRGYAAVVTLGNTPNTDILVSNAIGSKFAHIQVKTFVPGNRTCTVSKKAEYDFGPTFFWILAGIPLPSSELKPEYFIIPSKVISKHIALEHQKWLSEPGKNNQPHRDSNVRIVHLPPKVSPSGFSIEKFRNRWDLLGSLLAA